MAYDHVQSTSVQRTGVTTTTIAFGSDVASGNLLVPVVTTWANTVSSQSWSVGGSSAPTIAISNTAANAKVYVYQAPNSTAGAHTWSITMNTSGDCGLALHEYSGILTSAPLDETSSASGSSNAANSGTTATLAQTDNLVFGAFTHDSATTTITPGGSFTQRQEFENNSTSQCIATEDMRVTATTGVSANWSTPGSVAWRAVVAVFNEAETEPPPPAPLAVTQRVGGLRSA